MNISEKEKQIKNSIIYMVPTFVDGSLSLIAIWFFTRVLTKEEYGILALAEIYPIFITGIVNFGMLLVYDRNFFKYRTDDKKSAQLLYSTLGFIICNFAIAFSLTCIFQDRLSFLVFRSLGYGKIIIYSFCAQFIMSIKLYYLYYYKNAENAAKYSQYIVLCSSLNFVIAFYLVFLLRIGVMGIVYAQLFSSLLIVTILAERFLRFLPFSVNKKIFWESFKIGYPLLPRLSLNILGAKVDKYMINLWASLGGVGVYTLGQNIAYIVFIYMTALENVFSPQMYKKMFDLKEAGSIVIGRYLTPFAYISVLPAFMLILFAPECITLLMPVSYHGVINIIIVFALYYGFLFFGKITGSQLIFAKKTHITSLYTICVYALNIALNIPFILRWGAMGAAWATFITGVLSCIGSWVIAQKYYRIDWEYAKVGTIFLLFFVSALVVLGLGKIMVFYPIQLIVKIFLLVGYIMLGATLRVLTRDNFIVARNIFLRKKPIVFSN